jgi:hypothetical protein
MCWSIDGGCNNILPVVADAGRGGGSAIEFDDENDDILK